MGVRTRRRAVAAVLAVVALAACGQDSGEPAADEATTSSPPPSATPTPIPTTSPSPTAAPASAAGDVTIELLEAGAEPRQVMRLDPEAGRSGRLEMRMEMDSTVRLDGEALQQPDLPTFVLGMAATVDEVTEDTIRLSYTYDTVGVDGDDPGGVEQALASMEGLTGSLTTTRAGAFVDGDVQVPDGLHPTVASSMEQFEQQLASMTVPLPTDPVGPGARWRVTTAFGLNGLETETTARYELLSIQDGEYELAVDIEQRMMPGPIGEGGATIDVLEGGGTGSGTVTGSLDFPLAVAGRTQMESSMAAELAAQDGQTQRMDQEISMTVEMSSR